MRRSFFQVTGTGSLCVDHAGGESIAHRPGEIFEESPLNKSVVRALRTKRVRELDPREVRGLRMAAQAKAERAKVTAGPPPASVKTASKARQPKDDPIVILPDES